MIDSDLIETTDPDPDFIKITLSDGTIEYVDPENYKEYIPIPTLQLFHESPAQIRCIVGPVGSGKTTAAAWEICYYLPHFLYEEHNIRKTKWCIVRNTYEELIDTTQKTVFQWFRNENYQVQRKILTLYWPQPDGKTLEVEILFRSCDRVMDKKKFKSLELTGYWVDESIEVAEDVKRLLKTRIKRLPQKSPVRFGIETTNPPDIEHPTYYQFKWMTEVPGPLPEDKFPLENHAGFWQPPGENNINLDEGGGGGYYENLRKDYADNPDWADMYIDGKPGIIIIGKLVYNNFIRKMHVSTTPLKWSEGPLYRCWDNSGNCPAAVVFQIPTAHHIQVLREFHTDKKNIIDFTDAVVIECNKKYPGATYTEYADPAGSITFSSSPERRKNHPGEFTSNAQMMLEDCGIAVIPSEQNLVARIGSVDRAMGKIDGMLIDPGCTRLINGFIGGYCYQEIGHTGVYALTPYKNRFSHVHDALQYGVVMITTSPGKSLVGTSPKREKRIRRAA